MILEPLPLRPAVDQVIKDPEEMEEMACTICGKKLQWTEDHGIVYIMDVSAEAECCGRIYGAYAQGFKIYSHAADGN